MECIRRYNGWRLIYARWALRILSLLIHTDCRFSELKAGLKPITPRALSEELKQLDSEGYIKRKVMDDYPPTTHYALTAKSSPFIAVLEKTGRI
jgi:DNA-binding HxlR family transcriptional regulator